MHVPRLYRLTALAASFWLGGGALAQNPPRYLQQPDTVAAAPPDTADFRDALAEFVPIDQPGALDLDLERLERRHFRNPSNTTFGRRLAEAYLLLGRTADAKRVLQRFPGLRRTPAELYFLLASIHFAEGEYLLAEAVCATGLRRHRKGPALAALHARARTRQGYVEEDAWAMREAMRHTPTLGLQVVALGAFEQGDLVTGLLAAEALYFQGGYSATTRAINRSVELVYDGLIRAAARGREGIEREYPAGSFEADYRASLLAATEAIIPALSEHASRLELFAAIRTATLEHYLGTYGDAGELPRALKRDRPYVAELFESVAEARRAGRLRWFTMASLRDLDYPYFAALTNERAAEWEGVREAFAEHHL